MDTTGSCLYALRARGDAIALTISLRIVCSEASLPSEQTILSEISRHTATFPPTKKMSLRLLSTFRGSDVALVLYGSNANTLHAVRSKGVHCVEKRAF